MGDRAPAYRGPVFHFDALRPVALREGDRIVETHATENERKMIIRTPAHVHTKPRQLFAAGASLQPTPSPLCELA